MGGNEVEVVNRFENGSFQAVAIDSLKSPQMLYIEGKYRGLQGIKKHIHLGSDLLILSHAV